MKLFRNLQASLFYTAYTVVTIIWGTLSLLIGWLLPYRLRFSFIIGVWTRMVLLLLRLTCGIRHEIHGLDNVPTEPCILFCKHESTWETLALQALFSPQATLIKRELLNIPFFGWAFRLLRPIAINRKEPRTALKQLIREGKDRLDNGIWVLLFPEGTRTTPGEVKAFQAGGSVLAASADQPVLVITHNAGTFWPAHQFTKRPGVIQLHIGEPIDTANMKAKEINAAAHQQMVALTGAMHQTSRLTTDSALDSMNSRRGST